MNRPLALAPPGNRLPGEPALKSRAADAPNTFPSSAPDLRDAVTPAWVDPYLKLRVWDDYGMRKKRRC
jgi:hypothetical protein